MQLAAPHDTRWQQRQFVDLAIYDQRVARVMPSLEPRDHIRAFRQPVDNLAFAFVTPLGTDHHYVRHCRPSIRLKPFPPNPARGDREALQTPIAAQGLRGRAADNR